MHYSFISSTQQPVLPSHGGLLGKSFKYLRSSETDVRLTWARARAAMSSPAEKNKSIIEKSDYEIERICLLK